MFLPVESNIEGNKIIYRKQNKIQRNKERENFKSIDHNFRKGDWATLTRPGSIDRTLDNSRMGPYKVVNSKIWKHTNPNTPFSNKKC